MSDCIEKRSHSNARALWIRTYGPLPKGIKVCHTCDNPLCINMEHLFLGTQSENLKDCVNKGRHVSNFKGHKGVTRSEETRKKISNKQKQTQEKIKKEKEEMIANVQRLRGLK